MLHLYTVIVYFQCGTDKCVPYGAEQINQFPTIINKELPINKTSELFTQLQDILKALRHPETGCPWDREQTPKSLIPNFIEEIYEAVEAIEDNDNELLVEELGDILLHIMLQVQIAEENNHFTIDDILSYLNNKLIRRHPHVFNVSAVPPSSVKTPSNAKQNWEKIKQTEKKEGRQSVLDGVPRNLPALIQAHRIQEKAASVGFDWASYEPVFDKIQEEIDEVKMEINRTGELRSPHRNGELRSPPENNLEEELGDLLFSVVNLSRKLKFDSETALRKSTEKFKTRFKKLEKLAKDEGINMIDEDIEVLDILWERVKS